MLLNDILENHNVKKHLFRNSVFLNLKCFYLNKQEIFEVKHFKFKSLNSRDITPENLREWGFTHTYLQKLETWKLDTQSF